MNYFKKSLFLFLLITLSATAQQKITLEEIWGGAFRTQGMDELQSMKNTNQYTVLNFDRTSRSMQIDLYDFATLKKVNTFIDTKNFPELPSIDSYTFDKSENLILIACNSDQIFRHSFVADYYLFDIKSKKLSKLLDFKIQEPVFSPDGKKIAFAKENNLFIYTIDNQNVVQITNDGLKNHIINGITDWVYEEEFAFVRAFDWNATSDKIAFIRFDETEVPEFTMDVYNQGLYPVQQTFKYPKAGEKNALVSLHIYDVIAKKAIKINLDNYTDFYIPRIKWTNDANALSAQIINRHQNNLDLLFINGTSGATKVILNEKDKAYIDITDNLTFLTDNSFIWSSEKDGYNHLYHYDKSGKELTQITKGNWEVTNYYGLNEKTKNIFYHSVEKESIKREVKKIKIKRQNQKQ